MISNVFAMTNRTLQISRLLNDNTNFKEGDPNERNSYLHRFGHFFSSIITSNYFLIIKEKNHFCSEMVLAKRQLMLL